MNEASSGKKRRRRGDFLRLAEPAHRDVNEPPGRPLGILGEQLLQQGGVDRTGAEGVHPDALPGELDT